MFVVDDFSAAFSMRVFKIVQFVLSLPTPTPPHKGGRGYL
jgi:hypothetical protein